MSMEKVVKLTEDKIDLFVGNITGQIYRSIIMMTPVDTGKARNNWQCSVGEPITSVIEYDNKDAIDKSGNVAVDKMLKQIPIKAGSVVWLTNNVDYIRKLEYGWSKKQAPDGMVRLSIRRILGGL